MTHAVKAERWSGRRFVLVRKFDRNAFRCKPDSVLTFESWAMRATNDGIHRRCAVKRQLLLGRDLQQFARLQAKAAVRHGHAIGIMRPFGSDVVVVAKSLIPGARLPYVAIPFHEEHIRGCQQLGRGSQAECLIGFTLHHRQPKRTYRPIQID